MSQSPTEIANRALDAIAINEELGDIESGGHTANVLLRAYAEGRKQLLRAAPWQFARKDVPLVLLADASGNTPSVGTTVPSGFMYEYAQPTDLAKIRFIPANPLYVPPVPTGNIVPSNSSSPLTTGEQPIAQYQQVPSRFLITNDPNYPSPAGATVFADGQSPQGSTVILSNVPTARIVYTFDAIYPSMWDSHFSEAMVAYLAQQVAMALWVAKGDKYAKMGMEMRNQQIAIAKSKLLEARVSDGNSQWNIGDVASDWMRARRTGGTWAGYPGGWGVGGGMGWGCWGSGWNGSAGLADGTSF